MSRPAVAVGSRMLAALLLLAVAAVACAQTSHVAELLDDFPRGRVEIASGERRHEFNVWIADTPLRHAQGLMFVRRLDPRRGMLFLYDEPHYASYWMKNTYVSLDILFIAADGRIINIIENTVPLSTDPLLSTGAVSMVLELVAGTTTRLGIRPGDRLVRPADDSRVTR